MVRIASKEVIKERTKNILPLLAPLPIAIGIFTGNLVKGKSVDESTQAVGDTFKKSANECKETVKRAGNLTKDVIHKTSENMDKLGFWQYAISPLGALGIHAADKYISKE